MLDVSTFLVRGQQYTFTLEPTGFLSYLEHPDVGAMQSALQGIASMSGPVLTRSTPKDIGGTDFYSVSFLYSGDGSDTVASMYQVIADAFAASVAIETWDFLGADTGGGGYQEPNSNLNLGLPSSSWLWAIATLAIVALFVYTGGATAIRRALA